MKKIITTALATMVAVYGYSQTLQSVTDNGNSTSNGLRVTSSNNLPGSGSGFEIIHSPSGALMWGSNGYSAMESRDRTNNVYKDLTINAQNTRFYAPGTFFFDIGNVGIGTSSTTSALDIYGTGRRMNIRDGSSSIYMGLWDGVSNRLESSGKPLHFVQYDAKDIQFSTNNSERLRISSTGNVGIGTTAPGAKQEIYLASGGMNQFRLNTGFNGGNYIDINPFITGINNGGFSISQNGNIRFVIDNSGNGNVGIGTSTPNYKLEVAGDIALPYTGKLLSTIDPGNSITLHNGYGAMKFSTGSQDRLSIDYAGNVAVGTEATNSNLYVHGTVKSKEVKVEAVVSVPDYVFEKSYDLKSLQETEKYIAENKHLPEIPSAREIEKDGIKVGEMQMKLLQKIEELTLHLIEQNKRIENQEKVNAELLKRVKELEK